MSWRIEQGDCLDVLRSMPDESVDSCVTDPPYGLEFMGKDWDGADGFRRSLNTADVERETVFGRTSRTSPEYRAGELFQRFIEAVAVELFLGIELNPTYIDIARRRIEADAPLFNHMATEAQ